jgi:hypothetical protein
MPDAGEDDAMSGSMNDPMGDPPPSAGRPRFTQDALGRLSWTDDAGTVHVGVVPVRAFPLAAPDEGVSIVGADGHERLWIDRLDALPPADRAVLERELADREVMPEIRRIVSVSTFSTPSVWTVETDRGTTELVLKGEDDIRRLVTGDLLIADSHGLHFRVRQPAVTLDRASRKLLERFL